MTPAAKLIPLVLLSCLWGSASLAATPNNQLKDLRGRMQRLQKDLSATQESKSGAEEALRKSEQSISNINRALYELNQQQQALQSELDTLHERANATRQAIAQSRQDLAVLLRKRYEQGTPQALPLLLSGKDPEQTGRLLDYLDLLAQSKAQSVDALRDNLQTLSQVAEQRQSKLQQLAQIQVKQAAQRKRLQTETATRAKLVGALTNKLTQQKRSLDSMQRDEKHLTQLVEQITQRIALRQQQRRKQQAREARQRAASAVREETAATGAGGAVAARARRGEDRVAAAADHLATALGEPSRSQSDVAAPGRGNSAAASVRNEAPATPLALAKIDETPQPGYDGEGFNHLKGHLRLPIQGELLNRFGSPRADTGLTWRGLFIRAPEGRQALAVAAGRVVFADWLRGFGNLLIVDHGAGYMSLYGSAQSLFVRVGDLVQAGTAVASAGSTGGNPESGLYFELRYQSKPFDPLGWVGRPE